MADNTGDFVLGFLIGVAAGAVAALLLAPNSGEETLRQLQEKGIELKAQVQTQAEQLAEQAKVQAEQARIQAQQVQERGRSTLADTVKKAQQAVDSAQQKMAKPGEDSGLTDAL